MKRAEHQPETVSVSIYAGIYYKVWRVPDAETAIPQHSHRFDHITALLHGSVRLWRDGELMGDYRAPATIRIPAHTMHMFLTMEPDCMLACIHNADHVDGDEPAVAEYAQLELED